MTAETQDSVTVEFYERYTEWTVDTDEQRRPVRKRTYIYPALTPQELKLRGPIAEAKLPERVGRASHLIMLG
ncbi:MAG: hypothetical protein FJ304_03535 [Planctomycetes bacterium]|nr:hypothetical protein [Planctomycetota bacterium]